MKRNQRGFTLVELLVVIAIIGLLSTIGVVSLNSARAKARDAKRLSDIRQLASIMELYFSSNQQYPFSPAAGTTLDGGCISEKGTVGVKNAACLADGTENPVLVAKVASAPGIPSGETYKYIGYLTQTPSAASGSICDGSTGKSQCLSYAMEFTLETTISGVGSGKKCLTQTGIINTAAGDKPCLTPT